MPLLFTDCVPDEIYLACWHSLRTTCKWCQPSQLALIQTWDRRPNMTEDGWAVTISSISISNIAQAKYETAHRLDCLGRSLRLAWCQKQKEKSSRHPGGSLRTHSSPITHFSTLPFHPPRALWWKKKKAKWSRFCEHHLAAHALIAPITSLTSQPTAIQPYT